MKKQKKLILIGIITAVILIITAILLFVFNRDKDISRIVGKNISLSECLEYCSELDDVDLNDDFSKAYVKSVSIKVTDISEKDNIATVEIKAPPLDEILKTSIPENTDLEYEKVFKEYLSNINSKIETLSNEQLQTKVVEVSLTENKGTKILINNDFVNAALPNIDNMLSELLINMLGGDVEWNG